MGVGGILRGHLNVVLNAGQRSQLSLYDNAVRMRILNDLFGDLNVLIKRLAAGVDHN